MNCQYSRILLKKLEKFVFIFIDMLGCFACLENSPRELKRAGVSRFATSFLTLKSFEENKLPLRAMFASEEWAK